MLRALLAGAAVTCALSAGPTFAQPMKLPSGPMPRDYQSLPQEPSSPAEWAQVHRDWQEMSREWDARQRSGTAYTPQPGGPSAFGGYGSVPGDGIRDPTRPMPPTGTGMAGLPREPMTPAERAQVRRDWDEMAREWEARQRSGGVPPQYDTIAPSPYAR